MATEPILGLSKVRSALLDDLPFAARRRSSTGSGASGGGGTGRSLASDETRRHIISAQVLMNTRLSVNDEDDEVLDDEEFDEDADLDEDDEDGEDDDEEEEETWQVAAP
jgi:hypothetical protein